MRWVTLAERDLYLNYLNRSLTILRFAKDIRSG